MDRQIQKLKKLIDENLYKSKAEVFKKFGKPHQRSDDEIWFYRKFSFSVFNDEISIIFEEDIVVDICLTRFFLWIEVKNVYYFDGPDPKFKVVDYF